MKISIYQKIWEACKDVDSAKRAKLLRIYLYVPSLPKLRALRASLAELKGALKRRNGTDTRFPKGR